jgi:hypothetical protein
MPKGATMINPATNLHVGAPEMMDRRRRFLRAIHAGSDEQPRIGSFATGLASVEPRPWNGKQLVGTRGSGSAGAHADERPTFGSFATGLASIEPRSWDSKQMVAARGSASVSLADAVRPSPE